jgi:hypothetical protein
MMETAFQANAFQIDAFQINVVSLRSVAGRGSPLGRERSTGHTLARATSSGHKPQKVGT